MLQRSLTCFRRAKTMYSRLVSLKPPLRALVSGVRMASVMTMSSAFLEVLHRAEANVSSLPSAR